MANEKRLIDANALKEKAIPDYESGEMLLYGSMVDEAPTVDAVEVVHGRWKEPYRQWVECSECGTGYVKYETYNYCPNCGADMRGNDDDNDT